MKIGRPLKGEQKRITRSIRIEPSLKVLIEEKFGTIQAWFDARVREEFGGIHEAIVVRRKQPTEPKAGIGKKRGRPKKEVVTVDDF